MGDLIINEARHTELPKRNKFIVITGYFSTLNISKVIEDLRVQPTNLT